MAPELKARTLRSALHDGVRVRTDVRASPTGFPFKVVELEGTNAEPEPYAARERVCDLGYLRTAYKRADGRIDYRCPAEPVDTFVKKGGTLAETEGRKCLCNALMANIGHAQARDDGPERAILTSGDDLVRIVEFLDGRARYSADDVLDYLVSGLVEAELAEEPAPAAAQTP